MKYVIDIDGTICTETGGDYEKAEPFLDRIEYINKLHDAGHEIVYHTARGMGRFNGDRGSAIVMFYELTTDQLLAWGAKYDDLILGKPAADAYIDNKGIDFNKFFGEEDA